MMFWELLPGLRVMATLRRGDLIRTEDWRFFTRQGNKLVETFLSPEVVSELKREAIECI